MADSPIRRPIWRPNAEQIATSQLTAFSAFCHPRDHEQFTDPEAFYEWSVANYETFWSRFLAWSDIRHVGDATSVCTDRRSEQAHWFPDLRLNYTENLLRVRDPGDLSRPALTAYHAEGPPERLTRGQLRDRVSHFAAALRDIGTVSGDCVVAVVHNNAEAVIGALAATAIGATFSSAAPDMRPPAILGRFGQLAPKVMLANLSAGGNPALVGLPQRIAEVARKLPSLTCVVVMDNETTLLQVDLPVYRLHQLARMAPSPDDDWEQFGFNHPLFTLFSSGTTGAPKAIVHGSGGTLLEHVKEHRLHGDLRPSDKMFFHTSAAWMMWNWQLSALASGVELVLYDGPVAGPRTLWEIVAAEDVTVFGTSPPYLQMCEDAAYSPRQSLGLGRLQRVLSTGSILYDSQYRWVRDHVGSLPVQSISGGTDILGCFVLGHPHLPVHPGECQSRSLGLDLVALRSAAAPTSSKVGELVCRNPFPSRPLHLMGDPDGRRFHDAYFRVNPGVWTQGDLIEITDDNTIRMHGRSDGVLNVGGVRIGPAEIYAVLQGLPEIRQAMVVEQRRPDLPEQSRLVLLLVMRTPGGLDDDLERRIRWELGRNTSPAHVPRVILEVSDLPHTYSGKASERAASDALNDVIDVDLTGLRNPESLQEIRRRMSSKAATAPSSDSGLREAAPRDLPALLRALWEELLGLAPVRDDDNFFDLGGTSLLAARLLEEVHARTGIDVPSSALLEARTLSDLIAVVSSVGIGSSSRLVVLKSGTGAALFLLPGLGGDLLQLRALGLAITTERPVYGVASRALLPKEPGEETVEEIAVDCLRQVQALQPHGPYALAGYSFGGLVAYEMARILSRSEEQVEFLGLLDTEVHHDCLAPAERRHFVRHRLTIKGRGLPRLSYKLVRPLYRSTVPSLQRQWGLQWNAFTHYRPAEYDGPVTYIRCSIRRPGYCDPLSVWARAAGPGLTTYALAGSHDDLVRPPLVHEAAALIAGLIAGPHIEGVAQGTLMGGGSNDSILP